MNLTAVVQTKKLSVPPTTVPGSWQFSCTGKPAVNVATPTHTFTDVPYGTLRVICNRIDAGGFQLGGAATATIENPAPAVANLEVDVANTLTVTLA